MKTKPVSFVCVLAIVSCALLLGSSAWPQAGSKKEAYSTPISDNTLTFEVTLPSGKVAKMLTREGEMVKFGDLTQGYAFALIPVIKDMTNRTATLTVFTLVQDEGGNEMVRQVERVDARAEAAIATKTEPTFQIRLISLEKAKSASASDEKKVALAMNTESIVRFRTTSFERADLPLGSDKQGCTGQSKTGGEEGIDCCLRCPDGVWVCALCVWMDCGCCCDPPRSCLE